MAKRKTRKKKAVVQYANGERKLEDTGRKVGRPKGARTAERLAVLVKVAQCPKCQSTEREPYRLVRETQQAGTTPGGEGYTHIVWRRTRCSRCGCPRTEIHFEAKAA